MFARDYGFPKLSIQKLDGPKAEPVDGAGWRLVLDYEDGAPADRKHLRAPDQQRRDVSRRT
jgi:hypothetical protein